MIKHIVLWKFAPDTTREQQEFFAALRALQGQIPQIRAMELKQSCNAENVYDAVLIAEFDSLADLAAYKADPRHVAASALCKSIRIARSAIDIECRPLCGFAAENNEISQKE